MNDIGVISLPKGRFSIVDADDFALANRLKWCVALTSGYIGHKIVRDGKQFILLLHRFLTGAKPGQWVDHKNHCVFDNRRSVNLRFATPSQSKANTHRSRSSASPFKGVYRASGRRKWTAVIMVMRKRKYLGQFHDPVDAAKAYNSAARKHFGEFALLNTL